MNHLTVTSNAISTMTSREMADLTEKRHDNVKRTIDTLAAQGVISNPQIEDGEKAANGIVEKMYRIGKRDSYVIVAQLSPEFTARVVDRWQELEAKEPVEQSLPPSLPSPAEDAVRVGTLLAIALNLHGTEKASMISRALQLKAPEYVSLMPAYATNAPRTTDGKLLGGEGSSRPAYAASALLKKLGSDMTIHAFNRLAEDAGYLEVVERPSTKHQGVQRTFKAVSAKGLEFGYNLSNASSKGSTQPVWFQHSFSNLLNILLG